MNFKLIIIFTFCVLYGLFELFMGLWRSRGRSVAKSGDRLSIWIMTLGISVGYWLSFLIASTHTGRMPDWNTFFILGFMVIAFGLIIRVYALVTLKQYFTYTVANVENHQLIEKGMYKHIRHPGYLGQLIIFLGMAVTLSNWISIIAMMVPVTLGYFYRIVTEEKFMVAQMGEKYTHYKKKTKRLIPYVY